MKTSQLIKKLEAFLNTAGDLDGCVDNRTDINYDLLDLERMRVIYVPDAFRQPILLLTSDELY